MLLLVARDDGGTITVLKKKGKIMFLNRTYPTTRLRRLRQSAAIRALVAESALQVSDLIYPIFIEMGDAIVAEILKA